ncbi:MAG: nucleoside monophosphate kinase [Gammaproteobacteria bacterium]|nr:nucleoside monophosphate kinase [Gammaproteobacteria bacterium]
MQIALLGGPGSGKEIQARQLAERYRLPYISVAELLRQAAAPPAPGAKTAAARAARPKPPAPKSPPSPPPAAAVDDHEMQLLEERLRARDAKRGFVIDGFPRNIPEAQALDTLLGMLGRPLQIAVCLKIDDRALIKRVTEQLACDACGALYDRRARRRMVPDARLQCDACGGALAATSGHSVKTATAQVDAYHRDAEPLAAYYKAQHKLRTLTAPAAVDSVANSAAAADEAEAVQQKIIDLVDLEINPLDVKNLESAADAVDEPAATTIAGGQINRADPTENILAARQPGEEVVAATAATTVTVKKQVDKKPSTKKPAPAAKKTVAKKPAAKPSTQQVKKQPAKKPAAKPAAKKVAHKVAKKTVPKVAKKASKPTVKRVAKTTAKKPAKKVAKKRRKKTGHG